MSDYETECVVYAVKTAEKWHIEPPQFAMDGVDCRCTPTDAGGFTCKVAQIR